MSNKPLNIVHLSGMMSRGGGENHIINLTDGLTKLGHNSTVFCPSESQLAVELKEKSLQVKDIPLRFKADPKFFMKFGRYCKKHNVDLVHVHDPVAMFLIILANYFFSIPTTVYSKKTSFPIKNRKSTLYKYNHPIFKRIICVSKEVQRVSGLSIVNKDKLTTIYNGSNLSGLSNGTPKLDLRSHLGLSKDTQIVLHIANHTKPKDLPVLVKVVESLRQIENVHFVQIGRHTEQTLPIFEQIKMQGLEHRISFMGELDMAALYLQQADVSLVTSKSEGLPQVIYESMFLKVPIVSTKAGGIPEIINDQTNGFLAEIGDAETLARHIQFVITNRDSLQGMIDQNHELVLENYDSSVMVKNTLALYQEVLREAQ